MAYDDQILLLPRERYWDWLEAARSYVLTFGPNITSEPEVAARYMAPRQVITFPVFDDAYPDIGSPVDWFRRTAPGIRLDPIEADSPEALAKAFKRRVNKNDRYGARRRSFHLLWPTDYLAVTQPFGVNPQVYRRYGMPGHEGIDFRALTNTNIYACADGEVYEVYTDAKRHAYGIHIRIQHADGYKTVYAHLARALVRKGDRVAAGQVIGRADSTGNSSAAHLHLTLKRDGATARQETSYPKDILDPTPFLVWPAQLGGQVKSAKNPAAAGLRLGLNLTERGSGGDLDMRMARRLSSTWLLVAPDKSEREIEALRTALPGARLLARIGEHGAPEALQPPHFVARAAVEVGRLQRLGVRDFEVMPFPNEYRGGYGWLWRDGAGFGEWLVDVFQRLQDVFPEARFGYPCLADGGDVVGRQQDSRRFFEASVGAAVAAGWIGLACDVGSQNPVLEKCLADLPEKRILVTEVVDSGGVTGPEGRAIRLAEFVRGLPNPPVEAILLGPDAIGVGTTAEDDSTWEAIEILAAAESA